MSCCNEPGHGHEPPAPPPPPPPGTRMVMCKKFGKMLPGLTWKPYNNALGQRIYDEVSADAWKMWTETAKMILNEYRLNLAMPEAQKLLFEQADKFFFGPGAQLPPEFVPQAAKK